jgi:hypothetical protein
MSCSSVALIYAELLSNIGQVTVIAGVEKPITKDTRVELLDDKKLLRLFHDGQTISLALPAQIAAEAIFQRPALNSKEVVWRLPVARQGQVNRGADFADNTSAPWSANKLSAETQINCRRCGSTLIHPRKVTAWKDLPSENWAEMMDFWHCHKPHDHEHNGHASGGNKGYEAGTRFMAQPEVGFVDLTYFLFSEKDCTGVAVRNFFGFSYFALFYIRVSRRRPSPHEMLSVARSPIQIPHIKLFVHNCTCSFGSDYHLSRDWLRGLAGGAPPRHSSIPSRSLEGGGINTRNINPPRLIRLEPMLTRNISLPHMKTTHRRPFQLLLAQPAAPLSVPPTLSRQVIGSTNGISPSRVSQPNKQPTRSQCSWRPSSSPKSLPRPSINSSCTAPPTQPSPPSISGSSTLASPSPSTPALRPSRPLKSIIPSPQ